MIPHAPWAIVDLDTANLPERLDCPAGAQALRLHFRVGDAVLGRADLMASELPLNRPALAALAARETARAAVGLTAAGDGYLPATAQGEDLPPAALPMPSAGMGALLYRIVADRLARRRSLGASVVICTLNRPDALRDCLTSIADELQAGREIVVVDNGPDPDTRDVVASFAGVRYVAEPGRGLSRARNTGLAAITTDIAVFVDDDVRPEPGWIEPLLAGFDAPDVAVVCGLALAESLQTDAQVGFEKFLGFGGMGFVPLHFGRGYRDSFRFAVPVWTFGAGANMAVRRSSVMDIGGFDTRIGPGAAGGCGDDSELWHRALFAGYSIRYEPFSIVRHRHRTEWQALQTQAHGYFKGHVAAIYAQFTATGRLGELHQVFVALPLWFARRAVRLPFRRRQGINRADVFRSELVGYFAGLSAVRLLRRRKRAR